MSDPTERPPPEVEALARLTRETWNREEPRHQWQRARLLATLTAGERRRRRLRWLAGAGGFAVMLGLAAMAFLRPGSAAEPLAYEVLDGEVGPGGYVDATEGSPHAVVRFAEGSELTVQAATRVRLAGVTSRGAALHLERGDLHLALRPRDDGRWSVEAGPYRVRVTGTRFGVEWNAAERELTVRLESGAVEVEGPLIDGTLQLEPGQVLRADVRDERLEVVRANASDERSSKPRPEPRAADGNAGGEGGPESVRPRRGEAAGPRVDVGEWPTLVARGELDRLLEEAERVGLARVYSGASIASLRALADAARYRGREAVAVQALQAIRRRAAGSGQATDAAFLLGRLAERRGDTGEALRWYERTRSEPAGSFRAESLGRQMLLLESSGRQEAARQAARRYLEAHPAGAHVNAAHRVLEQDPR